MHEILARLRLAEHHGGQADIMTYVTVANDTGSNRQTVLDIDLTALGTLPTYRGWMLPAMIYTAGGAVIREQIVLEIQMITQDGKELTPWISEECVVVHVQPNIHTYRLSGQQMRNYLYFATSPGNISLYIAQKKKRDCSSAPCCLGFWG